MLSRARIQKIVLCGLSSTILACELSIVDEESIKAPLLRCLFFISLSGLLIYSHFETRAEGKEWLLSEFEEELDAYSLHAFGHYSDD